MRPTELEHVVGQSHLVGEGRLLHRLLGARRLPSLIFWGPPGTGKTTLARVVAHTADAHFEALSATRSGVKDLRRVVDEARERKFRGARTLLFVDEIHRFNKGQQDALLPDVEAGTCTLIGATTENPSFEVNAALLSRARVLQLRPLTVGDLVPLLRRALEDRDKGLGVRGVTASDGQLAALAHAAAGDARRALGNLEIAIDLVDPGRTELQDEDLRAALGTRHLRYDKAGEEHYNVVSAFIKSMRASDPDAAVYWLARMIEAGEDPMFVARRIVIFASEDVGNADPQALTVALACRDAVHFVGLPEAVLPLSQAASYMALAPKSNTALKSYFAARADVQAYGALEVPLAVRNAVTSLMKEAQYGVGYRYPHDAEAGVDDEHRTYLPDGLHDRRYVLPSPRGWEGDAMRRLAEQRGAPTGAEDAAMDAPSDAPPGDDSDAGRG